MLELLKNKTEIVYGSSCTRLRQEDCHGLQASQCCVAGPCLETKAELKAVDAYDGGGAGNPQKGMQL